MGGGNINAERYKRHVECHTPDVPFHIEMYKTIGWSIILYYNNFSNQFIYMFLIAYDIDYHKYVQTM